MTSPAAAAMPARDRRPWSRRRWRRLHGSSTRGRGWAPRGPASPPGCAESPRAARARASLLEGAQQPSSGPATGGRLSVRPCLCCSGARPRSAMRPRQRRS
eukprot:scaffold47814_cov44-Phaeocystis_antarctica.AAC.3